MSIPLVCSLALEPNGRATVTVAKLGRGGRSLELSDDELRRVLPALIEARTIIDGDGGERVRREVIRLQLGAST